MRHPHPDSMPTPSGWRRQPTGGGCWCFERELDGFDIRVTDAYGDDLPMSSDIEVLVGFEFHQGGTDSMFFEEGKPPQVRQLIEPIYALELTCPFDVNGDYFSWIIPKPDLGGGMGGWPHLFQILNTITKDSFIYEIVLPQNRPEE
jgi:hypothetical protein